MKKLVGFDLNGWADRAVRNWQVTPGEDTEIGGPFEFFGGIGGAVVRLDDDIRDHVYMGGMQAVLAPHGRGAGWGDVGNPDHRTQVLKLLQAPEDNIATLASALSALAPGGKATGILSIEDTPEIRETAQEALLKALRVAGMRRGLLVWRPVLSLLSALETGIVSDARKVGIVSHCAQGFSTQVLLLRDDDIPTPERRHVGRLHHSGLGLQSLFDLASKSLQDILGKKTRKVHLDVAQSPWRLALGEPCYSEMLRANNSDWDVLVPPEILTLPTESLPQSIAEHISDCDITIFDTPASGDVELEILGGLRRLVSMPVLAQPKNAVANGALVAARRLQQNEPIYFDFLPQISTIVQDGDGARNEDLIPDNARLRAGEIYRSTKPAMFALQQGTKSLSVFLMKENTERARKAVIDLPSPPKKNIPVALSVEQSPASGRARLTLISEGFSAPLIVNWEAAEEQEENWQAIIESQQPTLPTVPNRLVRPCGMESWKDQPHSDGLAILLERNLDAPRINWKELADKLSARPEGKHAISSDGELPDMLRHTARENLDKIVYRAEADSRDRLDGGRRVNNEALRFLTWLSHLCPQWIVKPMLDALIVAEPRYTFGVDRVSPTLLLQGIGRTSTLYSDQRRAFEYLLKLPPDCWKKDQIACASFLLSRNDSTPKILSRENVEFLADIVVSNMKNSLIDPNYSAAYFYTPFLLVGLLRWRLKEPLALVAETDTVADEWLQITGLVIRNLAKKARSQPKLDQYRILLLDVVEELKGQGTNPNLLLDLESLT